MGNLTTLKLLHWTKLDWAGLEASYEDWRGYCYVQESDVELFIENVYRDISKKLDIPYEHVKQIVQEENEEFMKLKESLFDACNVYSRKNSQLRKMQGIFKIPDVTKMEKEIVLESSEEKMSKFINMFNEFSEEQKAVVMTQLGCIFHEEQ